MLLADLRLAVRVVLDAALPLLLHLPGRAAEDLQPASGLHHSGKEPNGCKDSLFLSGHRPKTQLLELFFVFLFTFWLIPHLN